MEETTAHSVEFEILRNRMTNGEPFLRSRALERITALADSLYISQAEADELTALAKANGIDILPEDAMGRLEAVEQTTDELTLAMAEIIGGGEV